MAEYNKSFKEKSGSRISKESFSLSFLNEETGNFSSFYP